MYRHVCGHAYTYARIGGTATSRGLTRLRVVEQIAIIANQELADCSLDLRDHKVAIILGSHDPVAELHVVSVGAGVAPFVSCAAMLANAEGRGVGTEQKLRLGRLAGEVDHKVPLAFVSN